MVSFPGALDLNDPDTLTNASDDWSHGGMCVLFARHVQNRTGWPLVALVDHVFPPTAGTPARYAYVHIGVRTPDGKILDATGAHEDDDAIWDWSEHANPDGSLDGNLAVIDIDTPETEAQFDLDPFPPGTEPFPAAEGQALAAYRLAEYCTCHGHALPPSHHHADVR